MRQITELHNHSEYSQLRMLDCPVKVKDLIYRAVELECSGLALTDHESISGHVKAIQTVKDGKKNGKIPEDFKLILGNEIYLIDEIITDFEERKSVNTPFYHFILLAKDEIGHKQLRELSSLAWDNSFYTGKMERVPTLKADLKHIVGENQGHVIGMTACIGSQLGHTLISIRDGTTDLPFSDVEYDKAYKKQKQQELEEYIQFCLEVFGKDNFFLEMQPGETEEQHYVNKKIIELSKEKNIPFVITCDTHYLKAEDREVHAAYLNSRDDEERELGNFYATTYMMNNEEIHERMDSYIGSDNVDIAISNTIKIGESVSEYDLYCPTIVPGADVPDFELEGLFERWYDQYPYIKKFAYSDNVYDRYLLKLIEDGFYEKIPFDTFTKEQFHNHLARIEVELKEMWLVTEKLGTSISSYYLSTLELIDIMWNEGDSLVGIARGSVTGMFTMYLIGLIQMNPIPWGLPHWRHISHLKVELSDVDIDSQANRRKQIIEGVKARKGERQVLNSCTFKTEGSKSAILTAGRGLGIAPEVTSYIANMIPIVRGTSWTLHECVYGNEEDGKKPLTEFINECEKYPNLLKTAMAIEGIVCGRSIHASAVYLFNEDFLAHNARMKAPNSTLITQFNMKDSDYCSGLKMDFLTIQALDKIRICMDMLIEHGYMEWQGSLRDTYNKYLHPDVLDYDTKEMWDMVAENSVPDLFQFDTQVGLQAAKRIKPHSLIELATANSIMRLAITEEGAEQPIDTYIRYKEDINNWYDCMRNEYHLTENEIKILEKYLLPVYGVGDTQEIVMEISMDEHISNFNVTESNKLRKGISKKDKLLQAKMKEMFFEKGREIGTSDNLLNYVWKEVVGKQLGYSFSKNHTYPYSGIAIQELNLAYHYPQIYWNTSCLIVNAGADEDNEDNKATQYGKVATAISNIQKTGTIVSLPLINEAKFGFIPDEENNRIIYSLRSLCGIGDDIARAIVDNQPYNSFEDFCERMVDTKIITNAKMIILIKAGCFTELDNEDRRVTMEKFIMRNIFSPNEKLTLANLNKAKELGIVPEKFNQDIRIRNFKDYILHDSFFKKEIIDRNKKVPKCGYHDRYFITDDVSTPFLFENFTDECIIETVGSHVIISEKKFLKEWKKKQESLSEWLSQPETLKQFNDAVLKSIMEDKASGNIAKWEMDSLCFYYTEHALAHLNEEKYGVVNFFELPEIPKTYDYYYRYINGEKKAIDKYQIVRLAGTVLDNDNNKHMITLLTQYGVVTCKYNKGQYSHYNKRITQLNEDGKKKVLDNSWLSRGTNLLICGYRQDDIFRVYKYKDTIYTHTTYRIDSINDQGEVEVTTDRVQA